MFYPTESKPQGWRALAIFEDGAERLVYVHRSSSQVRAGYVSAFMDLFDEEERDQVRTVSLQRWHGAPDAGRWIQQTTLTVPGAVKLAKSA